MTVAKDFKKQFQLKMTQDQAIDGLRSAYGNELTAGDIRAFCALNDIGYATVCKKIKQFKVSKGRWNLEVTTKAVENIENSFAAPAVTPDSERNLIPDGDPTFVKFGAFPDIKKLFNLSNSIQHSLLDSQVTVKHSL